MLQNPFPQRKNHIQPYHSNSLKFDLKEYQPLLDEDVTKGIQGRFKSNCKNYCRLALPGILLFLSVTIMGLSYLSYDLHPLACIRQSEEFIKYNATSKRVELEFSDALTNFQKAVGIIVFVLSYVFLIFVFGFYFLSNCVINDLKEEAGKRIDEVERWLKEPDYTHLYF